MRFSLILAALFAFASAGLSNGYYNGYRNSAGYTYYNGYWRWSDGTYWSRHYDCYGRVYYQQSYYYPTYYPPAQAATPENYKEIVAKSLAQTKAHEEFMEAMELAYPDYQPKKRRDVVAPQIYGKVETNLQVGQSNLDVALTMQGLERMATYSQETTSAIAGNLLDVVRAKIAGDHEIVKTAVQGIVENDRLRALQSPLVINRNFTIGQAKPGPAVMPEAVDGPGPRLKGAGYSFGDLRQDCAGCHSGAKTSGGFNVDAFLTLPMEKRVGIVHANIMGKSQAKAMPRGTDGAWHRLPDAKITAWFDLALTGKGG